MAVTTASALVKPIHKRMVYVGTLGRVSSVEIRDLLAFQVWSHGSDLISRREHIWRGGAAVCTHHEFVARNATSLRESRVTDVHVDHDR